MSLDKGKNGEPGHTNRVFSVKFDTKKPYLLVSGGWDATVKVWD